MNHEGPARSPAERGRRIRLWSRLVTGALLAFLLGAPSGCAVFRELGIGGDDPEWVSAQFHDVHRSDLVALLATEVQASYGLKRQDAYVGEVESIWVYGGFDRATHSATRERLLAEVEREDEGRLELRVRVQVEINESPGHFAQQDIDGDWKPYPDDITEARVFLRKIQILLEDFGDEPHAGS